VKTRLFLVTVLLCLTGCSLFGGPTTRVRKFMDAAKAGDVESMNRLFSSRAIQRDGIEKIGANNKSFAELSQRSNAQSSYRRR
jgi:hypothetical protein